MWQYIKSATLSGGKKIRPYLTMIGYGGYCQDAIPVAASQELLHVAMLMHDDFIDEDSTRRGHKNIIGTYQDKYGAYLEPNRALHYAYGMSVIAGDNLISEAYLCIFNSNFSEEIKKNLINRLHKSIYEVIGGELMDVEAAFITDSSYDPLQIYRYKTAGYSFVGPLVSGAICYSQSTATQKALENFGIYAGIAFQLQDDLLGVFGDEAKIGKSILIDLREAKHTYLVDRHKSLMNDYQQKNFKLAFGNINATTSDLLNIRQDMDDSGAKKETENLITDFFNKAELAVGGITNTTQRHELCLLLNYLKGRKL